MAALGLLKDACTLREEDQFLDYTIDVDDEQFKVHKLVMVSVSDYFKVMLTGRMKESQMNRVRLEGQSSLVVAEMINFIYTGQFSLSKVTREELLACAMFLQIPAAIEECTRLLLSQKDNKNWFRVLNTFRTYGCKDGMDKALDYIRSHLHDIVRASEPQEIPYDQFLFLVSDWQKSEWDLFVTIKSWIVKDMENRKQYINSLMGHVRFALMSPEQVAMIDVFARHAKVGGSWQDLVVQAKKYHSQPIHVKVLDNSEQSRVRSHKMPIFYDFNENHTSELYALDDGKSWKKHEVPRAPNLTSSVGVCLAVNNFLVVRGPYSDNDPKQAWFIFDPRTMEWSIMTDMKIPRRGIAAVHHDKHLYALGGCKEEETERVSVSDAIEKYNFVSNKWQVMKTKMPVGLFYIGAAVVDNRIYVAGGTAQGECKQSTRFGSFNLTTKTWESKASMLDEFDTRQRLFVITLWGEEEVLFLMDSDFTMHYYSPSADQWSKWDCLSDVVSDIVPSGRPEVLVDQNTMYVYGFSYGMKEHRVDHHTFPDPRSRGCIACVKWSVGKKGEKISEVRLQNIPVCTVMSLYSGNFTVLLALNPQA